MTVALIYHEVAPRDELERTGFSGPLAARYKLESSRFDAHLAAIAAEGVSVGRVLGDRLPEVALTFDDGGASALTAALALERRGWRGHFFITTSRIGTRGFLSPTGILELVDRGHVVGSHSHTHPTYMGRLAQSQIEREWQFSRTVLGDLLGTPPALASLPGGYLTGAVVREAERAGYELLMTSQPTLRLHRLNDLLVLGRFTIWSTTPAARAAEYVRRARAARARLWVEWNTKTLAKRVSPSAYEILRRVRARGAR